ncbi:hypothetical protein F511_08603 [Dorcoceras hygrometricum]|uniref:Uncharacterized protein n=1 Tax=Dorcoceras hygrometricum TaxID=472368 RepID=A0A2Z7BGH7_9LAMI|nr:hypothetical protein F511_08603 [Dorcoceras hygrometricum]
MPPRRHGRGRGQFQESGGQNEDQYSAPSRTHESSEEGEAEAPPDPVEMMDVVIARFQRMNPPVFNGDESSLNQTLEEIRPAVTTSLETHRSIAGRRRRRRLHKKRRQRTHHRAQRSATLRAQHRPGGASRRRQRAASSATHARPRETKREKRRPSSAIARSRRAEWSGAKVRNKNARGGRKRSPKAAQGSVLPAAVLRNGSLMSTLQAAQRARSWREHRAAARSPSRAMEGPPQAAASDGLDSLNFDSLNSEIQQQTTTFIGCLSELPCWHLCLAPTGVSRIRLFSVDCGSLRQSGLRPDPRLLRQAALEALTRSARTNTPRKTRPEQFPVKLVGGGGA